MRILLVEDEQTLGDAVAETLRDACYAVDRAATGAEADERKAVNEYDLVILDWGIPPPTGLELLQQWRRQGDPTPVLMLTGRAELEHRISGLDSGADDYLTKPFALRELLARVRSLLRRRKRELQPRLAAGDLEMDRAGRRVTVGGQEVELSPKEFAVLEYLLHRVDQVVSRTDLIEHVWDEAFDAMSNVVDVVIYRLRKKIDGGREQPLLRTIKGAGYQLRSERESAPSE